MPLRQEPTACHAFSLLNIIHSGRLAKLTAFVRLSLWTQVLLYLQGRVWAFARPVAWASIDFQVTFGQANSRTSEWTEFKMVKLINSLSLYIYIYIYIS